MKDIRVLIADDDEGMRLVMRKLLERAEGFVQVGEAKDGRSLMTQFDELHPDVVLLDVEMPGQSGVECAKLIQDSHPKTILVFATAHEQYMTDAFQVYAFDYLLKPFNTDRFMKTFRRIRERWWETQPSSMPSAPVPPVSIPNPPAKLMIKHREGIRFLTLTDILLIQREDRTTVIDCVGGERLATTESLSEIEARLPTSLFFRTHKSYIIGLTHIETIVPYGRWTYIVRLRGTPHDALITHEKLQELQQRF